VGWNLALVGVPEEPISIAASNVILPRRNSAGSAIGSIAEPQEMLDFCAGHGIVSDVEMIRIDKVNEAYERLLKGDVEYRFVIDMASLKQSVPQPAITEREVIFLQAFAAISGPAVQIYAGIEEVASRTSWRNH
jgi:hypothetical protein